MKIYAIKTNSGFVITDEIENKGRYSNPTKKLEKYYFDNELPEKTFNPRWVRIKKEPVDIIKMAPQKNVNYRFVLIDESMKSQTIKLEFKREEVADLVDYEWIWKDDYKTLSSLYRLESDKQEDIKEPVEFEFIVLMEIDEITSPEFSYKVNKTRWTSDGTTELDDRSINHQVLDQILFPDIVLPQKPSKLSSEDSYRIVRQHIRENINPKVAEITSDYDFCFTVKKKILLSEVEKFTVDVNLFTKRKPKYVERYRKNRLVEVFEMTHADRNYKGYTPIKGFQGKSHEDLQKNIDNYLENLIERINKPLSDCPVCKGCGVIVDTNESTD